MTNLYPLAVNNEWIYKINDHNSYSTKIIHQSNNEYTLIYGATNTQSIIQKNNSCILTDKLETGNFQTWLRNDLQLGDKWKVPYKQNELACYLEMEVKAFDFTKEVEGRLYQHVVLIEGQSIICFNDRFLQLNSTNQYYYADQIGLIMSISCSGETHTLIDYKLF